MATPERVLCNDLAGALNKTVRLQGWIQTIRRHSKLAFVDLRDRSGVAQIVLSGAPLNEPSNLTEESVITVTGKVVLRPESLVNRELASGTVELQAASVVIEALSDTLPLPLNSRQVAENTRLKHRYLDLRRGRTSANIKSRHRFNQFIRNRLTGAGFIEVETPYISKSTPEGARDYLVPSRIDPGKFYALPQSPQQYKQLLMVAGFERYFQIVRCFRDEDSRGDRQPEFTQLDIEMSFTDADEVMTLTEQLMVDLVKEFFPQKKITREPFPRLTFEEATKTHQTDRPDLRADKNNSDELAFCFITDFPLFEWKVSEKRYGAVHHPFTAPQAEFEKSFEKNPKTARSQQYDLVLNGWEVAGGSIRIHRQELLRRVFKFLGHTTAQIERDFGHLLEAFRYGVPPHGGIALGLDRLFAVLLEEETIREVIAFPKSGDGRDLMMDAPSEVSREQLQDLGLKLDRPKS